MDKKYEALKLDNQLCFPLYAAAREVVNNYHPYLSKLDITYTQYIALMVMWEREKISAKELGDKLHLDSGTLTPLLKSLEKKGYVTRRRSEEDERFLIVELTD
ncbi:MAG: MarR family transcriptional regulator, partial [Lachnospiraceae bacterium]|nr:MarR family transcriptional regulator [Lachnospiraceae bacterium]